jgi:hypothetical protein
MRNAVFAAVADAVLEGSLPAGPAALAQHLDRLEETLAGFPVVTQNEIGQLLGLLSVAPGRQWPTGLAIDWSEASVMEVSAALRGMRNSSLELRQQTYYALRDLNKIYGIVNRLASRLAQELGGRAVARA